MLRIRLSELCRRRGISIKAMASQLGIEYQTAMYWNQGRAYPRLPMMFRLAQFFDCPFDLLIEAPDETES